MLRNFDDKICDTLIVIMMRLLCLNWWRYTLYQVLFWALFSVNCFVNVSAAMQGLGLKE